MAIKHQKGDVIVCVGSKSNERGDGVPVRVARRAKRFGWISRQRLSVLLLLIGVIFFICMTFFSVKVHFHGKHIQYDFHHYVFRMMFLHKHLFAHRAILMLDKVLCLLC